MLHAAGLALTAGLALVLGLTASRMAAADTEDHLRRGAAADVSPTALRALTARMDPYAIELASLNLPGSPEWLPERTPGWDVFAIDRPPSLIWDEADFDEARKLNALVPVSPLPNPPMPAFRLPAGGPERARALLCLSQAVYYEAGFEAGEGQRAVAQVVLNRLRHPAYPKSVCGVVYQGSQRLTGCQFSFTCDGSLARPASAAAWARAEDVARQALNGYVYAPVGASTHYHADYVFPYWAVTLVKLKQIGAHIFYRMTGPTGAPEAFAGRYAGGELDLPASVLSGGDSRTPDAPTVVGEVKAPEARTVTLSVGGETRTYAVGAMPGDPAAALAKPSAAATGSSPAAPIGVLNPARRQPTPDEIRRINEKLARFEAEQKATPPARPSRVLEPNGPETPVP